MAHAMTTQGIHGGTAPAPANTLSHPNEPTAKIFRSRRIITLADSGGAAAAEPEAIATFGDRIVAVGSDAEVAKLASPATRRIDLRGRAVIPGLIDNHMHLTRAGTTWQWEVRWDGVGSRAAALEKLRARAKTVAAGEWIYNLGGWAIEQFADDPRPFTREELDKVVPNNPVFLQASYYEAYINSARQRGTSHRQDHGSGLPWVGWQAAASAARGSRSQHAWDDPRSQSRRPHGVWRRGMLC